MHDRTRLPDERPSVTKKITLHYPNQTTSPPITEHLDIYIQVGLYPETGLPGEIFLKADRMGSSISGLLDALSMSVSVALQAGVPLEWFIEKWKNLQFEPAGPTDDPRIKRASSIMDAVARWLEQRFAN